MFPRTLTVLPPWESLSIPNTRSTPVRMRYLSASAGMMLTNFAPASSICFSPRLGLPSMRGAWFSLRDLALAVALAAPVAVRRQFREVRRLVLPLLPLDARPGGALCVLRVPLARHAFLPRLDLR